MELREKIARAWVEAQGFRWCDLGPLLEGNHLVYADAILAIPEIRDALSNQSPDLAKRWRDKHARYAP